MEEHDDIKNEAPNALNATAAATVTHEGNKNEALHQSMDIARHLEAELERNQSPNVGVLKITSGNVTKRLKAGQDVCVATWATKNVEASIKQIAAQEKMRMQEWKQNVMVKVAHKLQFMKAAQAEEMEAQRQSFQRELDMVKAKLVLSK